MSDTPADNRQESEDASPRTYAVGDVHGRLDLLRLAIEAISKHVGDGAFRVVFLGDYVDRGPESRGVIEQLIDLQRDWPVVCLKGNHEELMLHAVTRHRGGSLRRWLEYGGLQTLQSYGLTPEDDLAAKVPPEHLRWLASLPCSTGDRHRVYVHAGLLPRTPFHRQSEETFLWIRERFLQAREKDFDVHVVHGHTPTWEGKPDPAEPELLGHRTNIDTGAFATGVLTIAVFEAERPGGPVELLKVRGQAFGRFVDDPDQRVGAGGGLFRRRREAASGSA